VGSPVLVGFTGGRLLPPRFASLVGQVAASVVASGRRPAVGCASGADLAVRQAAPGALVFKAANNSAPALVQRSQAMVKAVAASAATGPGALVFGFPAGPCPSGIAPATRWRSGRTPSGTWSTLAFATGLGLPVVVFWCGQSAPRLPRWRSGVWRVAVVAGVSTQAWRWHPAAVQARLF